MIKGRARAIRLKSNNMSVTFAFFTLKAFDIPLKFASRAHDFVSAA